jgi:hypothetical protein
MPVAWQAPLSVANTDAGQGLHAMDESSLTISSQLPSSSARVSSTELNTITIIFTNYKKI